MEQGQVAVGSGRVIRQARDAHTQAQVSNVRDRRWRTSEHGQETGSWAAHTERYAGKIRAAAAAAAAATEAVAAIASATTAAIAGSESVAAWSVGERLREQHGMRERIDGIERRAALLLSSSVSLSFSVCRRHWLRQSDCRWLTHVLTHTQNRKKAEEKQERRKIRDSERKRQFVETQGERAREREDLKMFASSFACDRVFLSQLSRCLSSPQIHDQ